MSVGCIDGSFISMVRLSIYSLVDIDQRTGYKIIKNSSERLVTTSSGILRKVVVMEYFSESSCYLCVDFLRPFFKYELKDSIIPYYPIEDEMVSISVNNIHALVHITNVDADNKLATVVHYSHEEDEVYKRLNVEEVIGWDTIVNHVPGEFVGNLFVKETN